MVSGELRSDNNSRISSPVLKQTFVQYTGTQFDAQTELKCLSVSSNFRSKTNSYKQLKQELEDLRAETDKIAAEEDELLQKEKEATENLIAAEHSKGAPPKSVK